MLHQHYLKDYQLKLHPHLSKLLYVRKEATCCFLDNEYSYSVRTCEGRVFSVFLFEMIECKIEKISDEYYATFSHPFRRIKKYVNHWKTKLSGWKLPTCLWVFWFLEGRKQKSLVRAGRTAWRNVVFCVCSAANFL